MFSRDGAANPVYDGDHMESEVGLCSQVKGTSEIETAPVATHDEAMVDGKEAGQATYTNPELADAQPTYKSMGGGTYDGNGDNKFPDDEAGEDDMLAEANEETPVVSNLG